MSMTVHHTKSQYPAKGHDVLNHYNSNHMIQLVTETDIRLLEVSSSAFNENSFIPEKYTCDGYNVSPPLDIKNIPAETKSMAIIVDDPDAPISTWVHWLVWNIPVQHHIKENTVLGNQGFNDFGKYFYCGPCPMSGTHHYKFKVYALDTLLILPAVTKKFMLERAMSEHILAFGELTGLYKRKK